MDERSEGMPGPATRIFYEAEAVHDDLVAAAVSRAGPGPHVHVVQSDAVWLAAAPGSTPERVPSRRSEEFRRFVMAAIDRTIAAIGADARMRRAVTVCGVDVLEVARYEWLEALSHELYPSWVRSRLTGDVVVIPAARPSSEPSQPRRLRVALGAARRLLWRRPMPVVSGRVLFAEQYPAGAKVSAAVADRLEVPHVFVTIEGALRMASRSARIRSLWHSYRSARATRAIADPGSCRAAVRSWRNAASCITLLDDIGRRVRPAVVATSSYTGTLARAAVIAGRANGWARTAVYIQHGILFHYNYGTDLVHDHYLVWGRRDRDALIERGVRADAVTVVGSPTFERLAAVNGGSQPKPSDDGHDVLYLPSRTGGGMVSVAMAESMLDAVIDAVRALDGVRLTVKVHPRDTSALFDRLAGTDVRVVRDSDPIDAILAANAVVSATSTAGIEACALDRPSVILAFPGVEVPAAYEEFDAVLLAHDRNDTAAAIARLMTDAGLRERLARGRRHLIDTMFAGLEPGAADRAAAVLSRYA